MINCATDSNARVIVNVPIDTYATEGRQNVKYSMYPPQSYLGENSFNSPVLSDSASAPSTSTPIQRNQNSSPATVCTTLGNYEYDMENMRRLEHMMAQFNALGIEDNHETELCATPCTTSGSPAYNTNAVRSGPGLDKKCITQSEGSNDYGQGSSALRSSTFFQQECIARNYDSPADAKDSNKDRSMPAPLLIGLSESLPRTREHDPPPMPPTYRLERPTEEGPIVRLTQTVYSSIMAQISTLQKEKMEAIKKLGTLRRELDERTESERDVGGMVGKLRYQLEANKDYKAAMGRDIRQRDIQLYKAEMQIDSLNSKVANIEAMQKQLERLNSEIGYLRTTKTAEETALTQALAKATATRDEEVARVMTTKDNEIALIHKAIAQKDKEMNELKAAATRSQSAVCDHATRAKNLVDTQTQREKMIKQLQDKLLEELEISNTLRDEIEILRESLPTRNKLDKMQDELRSKTSELDRQRNENKTLCKLYERSQQALVKIQDKTQSLKGAAHLIIPATNTHLPKLVFPCMECFLKNLDCDASSRCHNCIRGDEKCSRWRCALRHVTGSCNQVPCRFVHDANGWLTGNEPRPKW
jgi:hypothetical protein